MNLATNGLPVRLGLTPGEAQVAIGGAIGTASLLFFWALGDIILGMLTFFTRGKMIIVEITE
jgi:hypothetical protein